MSSPPLLGSVVAERYRVDALIGEGAMGQVYQAEHVLMRKKVAIKLLRRELTQVLEVVQRFEREALAAAHIQHPHVASATDFGKLPDGSVFLVLEYVRGRSLSSLIEEAPIPVARVLRIGHQVASAIEAAHTQGIVHRDLKPDNIMLVAHESGDDFIKVLDFGIAKVSIGAAHDGKPITQAGMVYGTPEYMAPEQALGHDVDHRADLYSLGVILFELLCGLRPYEGPTVGLLGQQLTRPLPLLSERRPGLKVAPELEAFVHDLLAPDVEQRIPNALTARERLEELTILLDPESSLRFAGSKSRHSIHLEELTGRIQALRKGQLEPEKRKSKSKILWIAGAPLALVLAAGATLVLWPNGGPEPTQSTATAAPNAAAKAPQSPAKSKFQAELEKAKANGIDALKQLASSEPTRAEVHAELSLAHAQAKDYAAAVDAARVTFTLDPASKQSPVVAGALFRAAQSPSSATAAFRLLADMGEKGAEIVFDLDQVATLKPAVRKLAGDYLSSKAFEKVAQPALLIAARLARVKDCESAYLLVRKAALSGDERSLPQLERLKSGTGCGTNAMRDCFPCLRDKPDLGIAISAIQKRSNTPTASR